MIITDTYRENADNFKRVVGDYFGYSTESLKKMYEYIDDPTLILNDNAKNLFEKYGDEVVDYRIPLDAKKVVEPEIMKELSFVKIMLSEVLKQNYYEKYNTLDNGCSFEEDLIIKNKFMFFGEERKVWKFLISHAEDMARDIIEKNGEFVLSFWYNSYCLGPIFSSMEKYLDELENKENLLKVKIEKLFDETIDSTSNLANATKKIKTTIRILADIINAKNVPNYMGYEAFLSFNYFDWLLASTGESWNSCLSFNSDTFYGIGLPNLISCPDWGMVEVVKKNNKEIHGIKVPHIVSRTWVIYGENDCYNTVRGYPIDFNGLNGKEMCDGLVKFKKINSSSDEISKSSFKPFCLKDGITVPFIYADAFCVKPTGKNVVLGINNFSCGTPYIGINNGEYKYGGNISEMYDTVSETCDSISDIIYCRGSSFYDIYEGDEKIVCDYCGKRDEDCIYLDSYGYVCQHCIDYSGNFYYCEDCGELRSIDCSSYELVNGEAICEDCIARGYTFCEDCEKFFRDGETENTVFGELCEDCVDSRINSGDLTVCEKCGCLFNSEEGETICEECCLASEQAKKIIMSSLKRNKNEENTSQLA